MIGTVESALIRTYQPLWNCNIDGFGNHDPGSGRYNQERSEWDTLHPGRVWANRCAESSKTVNEILSIVNRYFINTSNV